MTKLTLCFSIALFLFGCSNGDTPKETVLNFIIAVKKMDFENAQKLVTDETVAIFSSEKLRFQNSSSFSEKMIQNKSLNDKDIIKEFGIDSFFESIVGKNAVVFEGDSSNKIQLEQVDGAWRILCSKKLFNSILYREDYEYDVVLAYQTLQSDYKRKGSLVRELTDYKSNVTSVKLNNKLKEIDELGSDISNVLIYNEKQIELAELLSVYLKTVDVKMDLVVQLEGTENRIRVGRRNFNEAAINYNKGFGKKVDLLPTKDDFKDIQIQF